MRKILLILFCSFLAMCQATQPQKSMKYNKLTEEEKWVILEKGTERPFTGKYDKFYEQGVYICKQCSTPLYSSESKFNSNCGWPSFDDEIPGKVKRVPDADGRRTEIICATCDGHLGHVFVGEKFTEKDTRHCVNSTSLEFIPAEEVRWEKAIVAGGCFWGVEYYFQSAKGVISTEVGYIGGSKNKPTYEQVSTGRTGHAEAMEVVYDAKQTSYEEILKLFFNIHDPTQVDRQGPDIGTQYRSEVFYIDDTQKGVAEKLIKALEANGFKVATKVTKATKFWPAENYHQQYYEKTQKAPYCHRFENKF